MKKKKFDDKEVLAVERSEQRQAVSLFEERFTKLFDIPLFIVDMQGRNPQAKDLVTHFLNENELKVDCDQKKLSKAIKTGIDQFFDKQESFFRYEGEIDFCLIPLVKNKGQIKKFLVIGPLYLKKGKKDLANRKLFSKSEFICSILNENLPLLQSFFFDIFKQMEELAARVNKMQYVLPGMMDYCNTSRKNLTIPYQNHLLNSLMEVCFELTDSDTGSVMYYNDENDNWAMKLAYGLRDNISNRYGGEMESDLANHVKSIKKAILINDRQNFSNEVNQCLRRNEIVSSMVIPLSSPKEFYGVFCLTSYFDNEKKNTETLRVLEHFGQICGVAISVFEEFVEQRLS